MDAPSCPPLSVLLANTGGTLGASAHLWREACWPLLEAALSDDFLWILGRLVPRNVLLWGQFGLAAVAAEQGGGAASHPVSHPAQLLGAAQESSERPLEYGGAAGGCQTPWRQWAAPHSRGSSSSFVAPGSLPGKLCSHPEDTTLGPPPDCPGPRLLPPKHPGALIQTLAVWTWPSGGAGYIRPWPCGWFLMPARVEAGKRLFWQKASGTEEREASGAGWTLLGHSSWGRCQGWAKGAFHVEEGLA